jgi:phosphohistidine swiveling domain-containing protein
VLSQAIGCEPAVVAHCMAASNLRMGVDVRKTAYVWLEMLTGRVVRRRAQRQLRDNLAPAIQAVRDRDPGSDRPEESLLAVDELLKLTGQVFGAHMTVSFLAFNAYAALYDLLDRVPKTVVATQLTCARNASGRPGVLRARLDELAQRVRCSPGLLECFAQPPGCMATTLRTIPEGRALLDDLSRLAQSLGDRVVEAFELNAPRWSEKPEVLLASLAGIVAPACDAGRSEEDLQRLPGAVPQREPQDVLGQIPLPRRWVARRLSDTLAFYCGLREETKYNLTACFSALRRRFMALADTLSARGLLAAEDAIFFLTLDELRQMVRQSTAPADLTQHIAERAAIHAGHAARDRADLASSGELDGSMLRGIAVSGGYFTGRARIVPSPSLSTLRSGEVLVAARTDPGWMPLFAIAGAVVAELGGMLSHTATLARELGKPAVFSVADVTHLIHDGQMLTVDGSRGRIYVHPDRLAEQSEDSIP